MRFNPRASIDESQIETRGGGGGGFGGGGMIPIPLGGRGRMGLGTIVLIILFVVLQQCLGGGGSGTSPGGQQAADSCRTGADANATDACAIDLFTNSVQDFWSRAFPQQTGKQYDVIKTVRFSGSTPSACGQASAQMGPFYCPNDKQVYLDTTFFRDMLQGQLGAKGGVFSLGYVIAHEYGHHIEDQLGILGRIRTAQGPKSDSVRVELMADCLAGVWAKGAQETKDANGQALIEGLNRDDIARAVDAAQAVGDDRIQQRSSGRVNTDSFTHGSSAQRVHWFETGLSQGTIKGCDTFAAGSL